MNIKNKHKEPLKTFISSYQIPKLDPFLEKNQFCNGMILFSVPEFGILFRCRAEGKLIDMEFAAFFALLKFITTDLKAEKIREIIVCSSNPEFVFSFTGNSPNLKGNSSRMQFVKDYQKKMSIKIAYIEPQKNKSLISAADYPSLPKEYNVILKKENSRLSEVSFKPFQKGIRL